LDSRYKITLTNICFVHVVMFVMFGFRNLVQSGCISSRLSNMLGIIYYNRV
jgi:hypothetical protein